MTRSIPQIMPALVIAIACSSPAVAAPALEVTKSVTINAPAPEVWDEVNDFDDLDEWTWTGAFDAKGADDKTATDTIGSVYQAGLDNLKKKVETGD
jgi:hypothetical protein